MPEAPRLLTDATDAFVDRAPIDWAALRARARRPVDRIDVEHLRLLDAVRRAATTSPEAATRPPRRALAIGVATLAAAQTLVALVVFAMAVAHGEGIGARTPQAALGLAFACTSLLLVPAARSDARSLFLLATFLATASAFARSAMAGLSGSPPPSVDLALRGLYPEAFLPACLWQFALDFPRVRRFAPFDVLARRITAVVWLVGGGLFIANLLAAHGVLDAALIGGLARRHPSRLFWRVLTIALAPSLAAILVRARRAPASERRRVARFAMAIALGGAPFLVLGVVRVVVPGADAWFASVDPLVRRSLDHLVVGALMAAPILAAAAVVRDRPFGSTWRPRTGLRGWTRARFRRPSAAMDLHVRLTRTLERLRLARGTRELRAALAREVRAGLDVTHVHVLVATERGDYDDPAHPMPPLGAASGLAALLRETRGVCDLSLQGSIRPLLPADDREWLDQAEIALAAPMILRDGQLAAVVAVGPRRDRDRVDHGGRTWLASLIAAATAMWEAAHETSTDVAPRRGHSPGSPQRMGEAAFECERCGVVQDTLPLPCTCDGPAALAAVPARLADKFLVRRRLGRGGMGVAYLAHDTTLDRDVVLKTLPALGPGRVARLQREARAMATLSHQGAATLYGLELWRDTPILVVEYFADGTLAQRIAQGPLPWRDALALAAGLARALACMHATGLLHRDVKPANIGLTSGGARLLDFGLAALIDEESEHERAAGTPAYMPPEAHLGAAPSAAFDLWSLSVTVLEAITGANPFVAATRAETVERILDVDALHVARPLASLHPDLPPFFDRALARDPARRFASAVALHDALTALVRPPTISP